MLHTGDVHRTRDPGLYTYERIKIFKTIHLSRSLRNAHYCICELQIDSGCQIFCHILIRYKTPLSTVPITNLFVLKLFLINIQRILALGILLGTMAGKLFAKQLRDCRESSRSNSSQAEEDSFELYKAALQICATPTPLYFYCLPMGTTTIQCNVMQ